MHCFLEGLSFRITMGFCRCKRQVSINKGGISKLCSNVLATDVDNVRKTPVEMSNPANYTE
jgi:hypothetical protein